ncbi:helix-turn-helix domain-containing protein [Paenibacillus glycinis]|uniref:MarR family transcriptional regulator n=1 Tax=Paenibacillus glycinis TaxID=2697035 RepID=A0ABW9XSD0_9BACL|nr:MarR family transcriptional regulator [Paenibacillus glycinis]NBD25383.1 MarR family transcriptional regulator [Paenibacillus glycinis]
MPHTHDEKLLREVIDAFSQFALKIQQEDDEEKEWLLAQGLDPDVEEALQDMTPMMLHVLDAIGKLGRANGIALSTRYGFPKGTVSKVTKRLASRNLIVIESLPGNKKELHFSITPLGEKVYALHERLDEQIQAGAVRFMADYSPEQLHFVKEFMQKLVRTSFIELQQSQSDSAQAEPEAPRRERT